MEKQLANHIKNLKKHITRGQFDRRKVKDDFALTISITYIENAIKKGEITEKQLKQVLKGR
jgi:hypothetical protein